MPRIYLPAPHAANNQITISGEKAHYLSTVLRCGKGDELTIFDGEGNCFRTAVISADRKELVTEVLEKYPCTVESPLNLVLVQSLLKGDKMDLVIQKTTELGVREIMPVITERSQLKDTKKSARWRKIAEEASRQSGRSMVPIVRDPVDFRQFVSSHDTQIRSGGMIFHEKAELGLSEAVPSLLSPPLRFFIIVGPEGGFTRGEVAVAKEKGLIVASLGKRILRAETAAISAVALVQYVWGDMG